MLETELSKCCIWTRSGSAREVQCDQQLPLHPQMWEKVLVHLPGFCWEAVRRKQAVTWKSKETNISLSETERNSQTIHHSSPRKDLQRLELVVTLSLLACPSTGNLKLALGLGESLER